jgi:hypothetical protein
MPAHGATMADLDLSCEQAAEQVLTRAREEELAVTAALQSALVMEGQILTTLASRLAGEQPRRKPLPHPQHRLCGPRRCCVIQWICGSSDNRRSTE